MPSTFTARNRLEKQAPGENNNNWGLLLNENMIDLIDAASDGRASFSLSGLKTLTTADGSADEARMRFIDVTGGTGGTVTIPNLEKWYLVRNNSSGDVIFTTGSGTTAAIASGKRTVIISTGSNVVYEFQPLIADLAAITSFSSVARTLVEQTTQAAMVTTGLGLAKGLPILCPGTPEGDELIGGHIAPYDYTITQANCSLLAGTAATAETICTLKKGATIAGAASIGTTTFAAAGTSATIAITGSPVAVTAGQFVGLYGPATADATIADLAGLFK